MNLTLAQLRLVLAVAETGSFTVAAERALISQPALSRAVRDVERIAGARLFDRTTRSVALTADGLQVRLIGEDQMVAVAPTGHPVAAGAEVSWRDWAAHPVVAFGDSTKVDDACRRSGVEPRRAYVADSAATVVGLVAAGLGVAAMPLSALPLTVHGSVTVTPLVEPRLVQPLAVVTRTLPQLAPPSRAFLDVLSDVRFDPLKRTPPGQRHADSARPAPATL